jgi:hypothetical protein
VAAVDREQNQGLTPFLLFCGWDSVRRFADAWVCWAARFAKVGNWNEGNDDALEAKRMEADRDGAVGYSGSDDSDEGGRRDASRFDLGNCYYAGYRYGLFVATELRLRGP